MAKTFKVVKNRETGEWVVKVYKDRKYSEAETYYTNDKQDAINTMKAMKAREEGKKLSGLTPGNIAAAQYKAEQTCSSFGNADRRAGCYTGVEELMRQMSKEKPGLAGNKRRR